MLFKLHYFFMSSGANALGILLGVYMTEYTDATPAEIGLLYMIMPFLNIVSRPALCSMADRRLAHRKFLIATQLLIALSFLPFIVIPFLGERVYGAHPRLCWYALVSFKIMGDIAFGGTMSIGDSLAINYASRIGAEFSTYRVWGTVSWMLFGLITGHLNEIWFLPKYVAGFLILVAASLLDALICFLWPKEYFEMVQVSKAQGDGKRQQVDERSKSEKQSWSSNMMRSLMPRDAVLAHAKKQLYRLVTLGACSKSSPTPLEADGKRSSSQLQPEDKTEISKRAQLATLLVLMRRDPRIILYLLVFILAGATHMPMSFFFMQLSEICHFQNTCNFSKLGGYVQVAVASFESVLFVHIGSIIRKLGRLNTLSLAFGLAFGKFLFYATIWEGVDPYWAIASEMVTGVIYGTFLTFQVEMGHLFVSEIEHIIPELVERKVVEASDESGREKLKLSLSATMQALTSSAFDGLGRGLAALAFGLIIDQYPYRVLWTILTVGLACVMAIIQAISLVERCFNLKLGFDHLPTAPREKETNLEMGQISDKLAAAIKSEAQEEEAAHKTPPSGWQLPVEK